MFWLSSVFLYEVWPFWSTTSLSKFAKWIYFLEAPDPQGRNSWYPCFGFSISQSSPWSVQFSCSVVSNSLWPHGLQHARIPCPPPTLGACSNSCPLSQWCHSTISSSVVLFSSHLQSFPASGSFPLSQFFTSGGQSIGVSASASVLLMNSQDWFPLGLTGLISLQSKNSQESYPTPQFKSINSSALSLIYGPTLTSIYDFWKNHSFDYSELCQ